MGKKLVIVESPAKAKTINKILGSGYVVKSSIGHVRDLPSRELGVDVENHFKPKYVVAEGKKKVIDGLKAEAKACDAIYLAPDPDREGEAIAWHIQQLLKPGNKDKKFYRVQYNEITERAVRQAFDNPGEINMARVDAQQARRVLDRIVGYMVSPMLWRRVQRGLSAGRVQSVALRLVCEREAEIEKFVPEPYWIMGAMARKRVDPRDPFAITLSRINDEKFEITTEARAAEVRADLEGRPLRVVEIAKRAVTRNPLPPFITSTLQQAASSVCGFAPKRTMRLAQTLYEGVDLGEGPLGLITYMRTDSVSVANDAMTACRAWVGETFGAEYVPESPNVYRSRSGAQEAHEAIRPTDVTITPEKLAHRLEAPELKLYRLIWDRFVASQMAPAKLEQRTVKIEAVPKASADPRYLLTATASDVLFPGFFKVMRLQKAKKDDGEEGEEEGVLPPMVEGESLDCVEWTGVRKETKPPARFSEAALIRELERNGVGRPSTYAATLGTLQDRRYIDNEKRTLRPTDLGRRVNTLLVETLNSLFDVTFTASMEESLDEIEAGKTVWTDMLETFYKQFLGWMENTKLPPADADKVRDVLVILEDVTTWAEPTKRGKRTYSDDKFVESVRDQLAKKEKAISQRQLEALIRIIWRYKDQLPTAEARLRELGFGLMLDQADMQPPDANTFGKLELALGLELNERSRAFVVSLNERATGGRSLSPAQLNALHGVLDRNAARIENYAAIREAFGMGALEVIDDQESGPLLAAMRGVSEWKPAVARGKRVFDDKVFLESLAQQFAGRGALSPRQRAALKKMLNRYRVQIPNFEALADQFGILAKAPKSDGAAKPATEEKGDAGVEGGADPAEA
ncbi:MAG: type I DNA topoisomerase [Verrucomicrobia bacterium]|nr:type I DNA topoisomerase [Verrucomicrobiota bacterium]